LTLSHKKKTPNINDIRSPFLLVKH
jgi:hypothetical protein